MRKRIVLPGILLALLYCCSALAQRSAPAQRSARAQSSAPPQSVAPAQRSAPAQNAPGAKAKDSLPARGQPQDSALLVNKLLQQELHAVRDSLHTLQDSLRHMTTTAASAKEADEKRQFRQSITTGLLCLLLLLLAAGYLIQRSKLRKMADEEGLRQDMIKAYTEVVTDLERHLVNKGALSPEKGNMYDIAARKKLKLIQDKIKELIDRYFSEDARNRSVSQELEQLKEQLRAAYKPVGAAGEVRYVPYMQPADQPPVYIKAEVTVSAGPRKNTNGSDTELGEDVAGVLSLPEQTFFWLLDGTSDAATLMSGEEGSHIFSSRLLAQHMGHYIQKNISRCFGQEAKLEDLLQQARVQLTGEWTERINGVPAEKKESIIALIRQGFKPLCSTTIILGRLFSNGQLYALRSGDSKLFPFTRQEGSQLVLNRASKLFLDPTADYDRLAFQLNYREETGTFWIESNTIRWASEVIERVDTVFVFSDGIGRVVEAQLASDSPGVTEIIKQNISRIPQKTYDDKSFIVLERTVNPLTHASRH